LLAIRTWKRDGTTNEMPLRAAAANLASKATDLGLRDQRETIEMMLKSGQAVETPLAVFRLAGHNGINGTVK